MTGADTPPRKAPATGGLALRQITGGYDTGNVVWGVDIDIAPGQIAALIGANGAGKTTLLRIASGLLRQRQGCVILGGQDVSEVPAHTRAAAGLCLIPEGRGIFPSLTVRENLQLQSAYGRGKRPIQDALEAFPALSGRLSQRAGTLSGGEQQMVALSRCYLAEPTVVLLDEVSMGLAPLVVEEIFESLRVIARRGVAMVLVEQYVGLALELADQVYVLKQGRIMFTGDAASASEEMLVANYLA